MRKQTVSNLYTAGVILGGILVNIPLGVAYYYGNLSTYTDSYFIASVGQEKHTPGSLWIVTLWTVFLTIGIVVSGILSHIIGPRLTLLSGLICFNVGIYTSFFALQSSFWSLHITLGVLTGIGAGFSYSMTLLYTAKWARKRVGLCSALVSSTLGGGSLIFNLTPTFFINPQNLEADFNVGESKYFSQEEIINRVPYVFLVIGALTTGLHVIAFPLMRNHPDFAKMNNVKKSTSKTSLNEHSCVNETNNSFMQGTNRKTNNPELYGATESADLSTTNADTHGKMTSDNGVAVQDKSINSTKRPTETGITPLQALQMKTFYLLAFAFGFLSVGLIVENNSYKHYGVLYISDDYFLANVGVGVNVAMVLSRIVWGIFLDQFYVKSVLVFVTSFHTILAVFWYFTPIVDKWFYLVWTLILIAVQSGSFIVYPITVLKIFGSDYYMTIFGMATCFGMCVQFAIPLLSQVILTETGWFWLFCFTSATSLISLILSICLPHVPKD